MDENISYAQKQLNQIKHFSHDREHQSRLFYNSNTLHSDKYFMTECAKILHSGSVYWSASKSVQRDVEFAQICISKGLGFNQLHEKHQNSKDFIKSTIEKHPEFINELSNTKYKNNKELYLTAITSMKTPTLIETSNFSEVIKHDKEVALSYINRLSEVDKYNTVFSLNTFSTFNDDKEVVISAVKNNGLDIRNASKSLKNDKEVVLEAVKQNGGALEYLTSRFQGSKEIVLEAVKQCGESLQFATVKLKDNKEVVLEAVKNNGEALEFCSEKLKDDKEVVLEAVKNHGWALNHASDNLKDSIEIVLEAVKQNGLALEYASDKLRDNKEVVLASVSNDSEAINYASDEIRKLCDGKDPIEALTKAIESEKLHEQLQKIVPPKTLDFARNLSAECKQATLEQSQQVAKPKARMKI